MQIPASAARSYEWQPDKTTVRRLFDENEFPEILVHGYWNAPFVGYPFKENAIAWVRPSVTGFDSVVSLDFCTMPPGAGLRSGLRGISLLCDPRRIQSVMGNHCT